MPPRMRTRSAVRPIVESLGGGTGVWVGRDGRGRIPREGNDERVDDLNGQGNDQGLRANEGVKGVNGNVEGANGGAPDFLTIIAQQLQNLLPAMLAQVSNQGNVGNQNGNVVNENIQENVGNVIGGAVVLTRWIEKMEYVHDMSGCSVDQKLKYTAGSFMGKALTWWNSQIHTLSREVAVSMSWNDFKFMMIQEFCPSHEMQKLKTELWNHAMVGAGHAAYTDRFHELDRLVPHLISGALTDKAVRNRSIKKVEKRGNVGEPSKDRSGLEPSDLGFKYEIEISSRQLVEINKVIKGCKLEIKGHVFDIDLIPFGHGSFDVIIGMDWLSKYKTEIICHEKVVRIPLPDGKVLRVLVERPEEKARLLMSAKASEKKQEEIVVVRDFLEAFPDDLSGLPPIREIKFRIELSPGAAPVAKSP
ncbi:putative reverse transcriptase domain-containing protein [Tanacetum coccineum]